MKRLIFVFIGLGCLTFNILAQESRIDRSTITIPNSTRAVMNLKVTDRAYLPMKTFGQSQVSVPKVQLRESIWPIDSLPKIDPPATQEMRTDENNKTAYGDKYSNAIQFGVGNYGHSLFKFDIGHSKKENKFIFMHAIKYFGLALIYTPASSFCLFFAIKIFNDPIIGKITSDIFLFALIFWVTSKFSFKNNFLSDRR